MSDEEDGCDDESLNDEVHERPTRSEVESALDVLKNASLPIQQHRRRDAMRYFLLVFLESTSNLYLLLCNAFNSYKKLIVHHITTYLFSSFSFPEIYELLSISNSLSISNKSLGPLRVRDRVSPFNSSCANFYYNRTDIYLHLRS